MKAPKIHFHFQLLVLLVCFVSNAFGQFFSAGEPYWEQKVARERLAKALEAATKQVEEYGSAHVSAPILAEPSANFAFELTNTAQFYFEEARNNVQGRASLLEQVVSLISFQGRATLNPEALAAQAAQVAAFTEDLSDYGQKKALQEAFARAQYRSAVAAAQQETNRVERDRLLAQAETEFLGRLPGMTNRPGFPLLSNASALPEWSSNTHRPGLLSALSSQTLGPFQALNKQQDTGAKINSRTALITAAGDNAVQGIFRVLGGDKNQQEAFPNRKLLYGLTTVSVNPGWRTHKDWASEINVFVEGAYLPARNETVQRVLQHSKTLPDDILAMIAVSYALPLSTDSTSSSNNLPVVASTDSFESFPRQASRLLYGRSIAPDLLMSATQSLFNAESPLPIPPIFMYDSSRFPVYVTAVSPLTDTETFDLAASQRERQERALALALLVNHMGQSAEGRAFREFVKNTEYDIATRTPLVAINTLSSSEGMFGFQVGPRTRAIADPGSNRRIPGNILERQSFPALILVSIDEGFLHPCLTVVTNGSRRTIRVLEPFLVIRQVRKWVPMTRSFFSSRDWYSPQNWFHPRFSEKDRIEFAGLLEIAKSSLPHARLPSTEDLFAQRIKMLEHVLVGDSNLLSLSSRLIVPDRPPELRIPVIEPQRVQLKLENGVLGPKPHVFTIFHEGLQTDDPGLLKVHGPALIVEEVRLTQQRIRATVEITNAPASIEFRLTSSRTNGMVAYSGPVEVTVQSVPTPLAKMRSISPTVVTLGGFGSTTAKFFLSGDNFDRLDFTAIKMSGIEDVKVNATVTGNDAELTVDLSKAPNSFAFGIPGKEPRQPKVITTNIVVFPKP